MAGWFIRFSTSPLLPPALRRNGEGNVFTGVCPSTPFEGGGREEGPSQFRTGQDPIPGQNRGGYPLPRLGQGYPPHPISRMGYPPSAGRVPPYQVRTGDTHLSRSGWGVSRVPPTPSAGRGTPLSRTQVRMGGYPQLEQYGVYLLRGGRHASCVHAGGLSCMFHNIDKVWDESVNKI